MGSTRHISVMASEGDFQNMKSMVWHTKETTHINGSMIYAKQTKQIINHAQNFALIMIKPQHSRNTTATS